MGKAIIQQLPDHSNYVRQRYQKAYRDLRRFYADCRTGEYNDSVLMIVKYDLWRKHGEYLDLAWRHHFALKVAHATGIGWRNGWVNPGRRHAWLIRLFAWEKENDIDGFLG